MAKRDLTGSYDYDRLIEEEKDHYSDIEVTQDLKEGGVHAGSSWQYYWTRVNEALAFGPVGYIGDYITAHFNNRPGVINILSLGSGYCGNEIELARRLGSKARIVCTDINEQLFTRGMAVVAAEKLTVEFRVEDLNFISIEPGRYHMIFAHAVLHHVINLESLFEEIAQGLCQDGVLHLVEVVGENRRLIWPENEAFANSLLSLLPDRITDGVRLAVVPEDAGMEGIRQEDIIPELQKLFCTEYEYTHGAFMRFVCTDDALSRLLSPEDAEVRRYLDFLIDCDIAAVKNGVLRPLEVWGIYKPRSLPTLGAIGVSGGELDRAADQNTRRSLQQVFDQLPLSPNKVLLKDGEPPFDYQRLPIERFQKLADPNGKTILEIGADDAIILSGFARNGMLSGLGINNWYWKAGGPKSYKLTDRIVLSYGDIRSLPLQDRQFDAIFTCAAFEHIHELNVALSEMHRLLKPGGLVYSYFGPLWSCGIGHHLWFERRGIHYRFTEPASTLPILGNYDHLLYDRDSMAERLSANWEQSDVEAFLYQIYDNPDINRYMYAEYIKMFMDSDFEVISIENMGRMEIPEGIHETLKAKYGIDNDFSCATMEVVLKKSRGY